MTSCPHLDDHAVLGIGVRSIVWTFDACLAGEIMHRDTFLLRHSMLIRLMRTACHVPLRHVLL